MNSPIKREFIATRIVAIVYAIIKKSSLILSHLKYRNTRRFKSKKESKVLVRTKILTAVASYCFNISSCRNVASSKAIIKYCVTETTL